LLTCLVSGRVVKLGGVTTVTNPSFGLTINQLKSSIRVPAVIRAILLTIELIIKKRADLKVPKNGLEIYLGGKKWGEKVKIFFRNP